MSSRRAGQWKPGESGNPAGRKRIDSMVVFDIKQAARSYCEEAIRRVAEHMRSDDEKVSLAACVTLIERGYGKPEQKTDTNVTHKFCVAPEVMEEAEWLARRGQPAPKALPPPKTNGTAH